MHSHYELIKHKVALIQANERERTNFIRKNLSVTDSIR